MESKYKFVLAKEIMERNAFTGAIIYAKQRLGKSSYALQVMFDIFRPECANDAEAWNRVLEHTFFKIEDILDFLTEALEKRRKIPVILWDDTGVHGNKLVYFSNKNYAQYLQNLFDVVGTATRGILLTTPNPGNLLKSLRDYEFMRIKITKANSNGLRVAKGYGQNLMPSGMSRVYRSFEDTYKVQLPDEVFSRYQPMRESFYIEALSTLHDAIKSQSFPVSAEDLDEIETEYKTHKQII
jgi:hypothetical protein